MYREDLPEWNASVLVGTRCCASADVAASRNSLPKSTTGSRTGGQSLPMGGNVIKNVVMVTRRLTKQVIIGQACPR